MNTLDKKIEEALATIGNEVGTDASTRALIGELIMATADWCKVLASSKEADVRSAMNSLMELIEPKQEESPLGEWFNEPAPPSWTEVTAMHSWHWPWAEKFRLLRDYGEHGQIWPSGLTNDEDYVQKVPHLLEECAGFLERLPTQWITSAEISPAYHSLWIVFGKARGRHRLEVGSDLNFHEVVLLSGMAPKSVRNATQERHGAGRLIVGEGDIVKNTNATNWLRERRTFNPTPGTAADGPRNGPADPQDFVFIPVDAQGREFDPELVVQGPPGPAYQYTTDTAEGYTNKYMEALSEAQAAGRFCWCLSDGSWTERASWSRVSKSALRRKEKNASDQRRLLCAEFKDWAGGVVQEDTESDKNN